MSVPHKLECQS